MPGGKVTAPGARFAEVEKEICPVAGFTCVPLGNVIETPGAKTGAPSVTGGTNSPVEGSIVVPGATNGVVGTLNPPPVAPPPVAAPPVIKLPLFPTTVPGGNVTAPVVGLIVAPGGKLRGAKVPEVVAELGNLC